MRRWFWSVFVCATGFGMFLPAWGQIPVGPFDVSLDVRAGSEYSYRGITQSNRRFAVSGLVRIEHTSGVFGEVGGANIDYGQGDTGRELDFVLGYKSEVVFTPYLSYEVGVRARRYIDVRNTDDLNYYEGFASIIYAPEIFSLSASINYSPDYYNRSGSSTYYSVSGVVPVFDMFELSARGGYQSVSNQQAFGIAESSYTDWSISVSMKLLGSRGYLSYQATDLPASGRCISANCAGRLVFGISAGF